MATTIRRIRRLIGLFWITLTALVEYAAMIAWRRDDTERAQRQSHWLHHYCRRTANLIRLKFHVHGNSGTAPLLACNHVSYLDIVALAAVTPLRFVAKSEVRGWPWLGRMARYAGTIFIQRRRRRSVLLTGHSLRRAVQQQTRVVMFLEGTSTDGETVLPFRSSLLAAAAEESWPVLPVWIDYMSRDVTWWGGMTLVPHLWRLLGREEIPVTIRFGRVMRHWDRKTLAEELHHAVCDLAQAPLSVPQQIPVFAKPQFLGI
jgi:1-acyl-sn-glycerol-3-phosphate acyltransferase